MQRKKLKVGTEYGYATYRDWERYRSNVQRVQVLDVGGWREVPHYRMQLDTDEPDTVQVPGSAPDNPLGGERLTVSKRYRRKQLDPFSKGQGNLLLVRFWGDEKDGEWGEPRTVETRHLVDTWEDAVKRIDDVEAERDARLSKETQQRQARERRANQLTERMLALGVDFTARVTPSRFKWATDTVTIDVDKLEQVLLIAERGKHDFETEGRQDERVITSCAVCGQQRNSWVHG